MKKLWIVLLSLTMVMSVAMSASALDVKFSGGYYVYGVYDYNRSFIDKDSIQTQNIADNATGVFIPASVGPWGSRALYFQRARVQTEFQVVEGLKLVTRFDALEKRWGDQTWAGATTFLTDSLNRWSTGAAGTRTQENIEFERAYVDFNTGIGRFNVGYQNFGMYGTIFLDTAATQPGLRWALPIGPVTVHASYAKVQERENTAGLGWNGFQTDLDRDNYAVGVTYKKDAFEGGMEITYIRDARMRTGLAASNPLANTWNSAGTQTIYMFNPYARAKFGSTVQVLLEGEFMYAFGKAQKLENAVPNYDNVDLSAWGLFLHGRLNINMFYGGLYFAVVSGDDPGSTTKQEGGFFSSVLQGQNWSPTLIFKNDEFNTYLGAPAGALSANLRRGSNVNLAGVAVANQTGGATSQFMDNIWFYQLYFGIKPTPKWDIVAKVAFAYADKKPWFSAPTQGYTGTATGLAPAAALALLGDGNTEFNSKNYGTEIDLVASYKIYDNLEYQVGFGYFFTGDYYKGYHTGTVDEVTLTNDYLLMHKLTLSF